MVSTFMPTLSVFRPISNNNKLSSNKYCQFLLMIARSGHSSPAATRLNLVFKFFFQWILFTSIPNLQNILVAPEVYYTLK